MLLSAVSVLVVVQSISEIPEGLMNNPVLWGWGFFFSLSRVWKSEFTSILFPIIPVTYMSPLVGLATRAAGRSCCGC